MRTIILLKKGENMKPSKIIQLDELAKLLDCPTARVKEWLRNQPEELLVSRQGKQGVDPVKLRLLLESNK